MFNYTVKVKHNNFKNRFKFLKIKNVEELLKIKSHFDVWSAIPTQVF